MTKKKIATKKPPRKRKPPFDGDSPIMVGGGGGIGPAVELEFDHNVYLPVPGQDRDRHVTEGRALAYILINGSRTDLPRKCTIVIQFQKGNSTRNITVQADPKSIPLGIKFNGRHLPFNHQSQQHRDDGSELKLLKITNWNPQTLTDESTVEIHTTEA